MTDSTPTTDEPRPSAPTQRVATPDGDAALVNDAASRSEAALKAARLERAKKGYLEMVPVRNLARALLLVALLAGVVWFRNHASQAAKVLSDMLFPPPPARPAATAGQQGRVVRMAPLPPPSSSAQSPSSPPAGQR